MCAKVWLRTKWAQRLSVGGTGAVCHIAKDGGIAGLGSLGRQCSEISSVWGADFSVLGMGVGYQRYVYVYVAEFLTTSDPPLEYLSVSDVLRVAVESLSLCPRYLL